MSANTWSDPRFDWATTSWPPTHQCFDTRLPQPGYDTGGAGLLFQVVADGYEKRSLIITTNLEFSRWGRVFGDDNMAAAVIDRIVHRGRLLQFRGGSYRVKHALMK